MQKLKSFTFVFVFVVAALGLTISSARAAILTVDGGGRLTGATNVDLGSLGFFNVSFVEGTCVALFTGCDAVSDFDFDNPTDALTAGNALLGQVFVDDDPSAPGFFFDTLADKTFGCPGDVLCQTLIPFALDGTLFLFQNVRNNNLANPDDVFASTGLLPTFDSSFNNFAVYADFTSVTPVPLPPAALLFVTALVGLVGFARRQRQRQA